MYLIIEYYEVNIPNETEGRPHEVIPITRNTLHWVDKIGDVHETLDEIAVKWFGLELNDLSLEELEVLDGWVDIVPHDELQLPSQYQ